MTDNIRSIQNNSNCKSNKLIYLPDKSTILNMPFILTEGKRLIIGMPYLKIENWLADSKIQSVRLLDIWDESCIVNIKIQDLNTSKIDILSHNLAIDSDHWLWSLASFDYLVNLGEYDKKKYCTY
jgi:hypothetical protein